MTDSTLDAEYVAASEATKDGYLIKKFIVELGVVPSAKNSVELYCDNSSAVALAKDLRSHNKAKHIDRKDHLIRYYVSKGYTSICKVHRDLNVADLMTNARPRFKFKSH